VQQAELLAAQYDMVVANPPYMGSGGMNDQVKKFAKESFANNFRYLLQSSIRKKRWRNL
jgi:tRNA1(Val) A37 N6-methylase TrmN6